MRIEVLGAGSWGTALATLLACNGHSVRLLGRRPDDLAAFATTHENARYLPGFALPDALEFGRIEEARAADLHVFAVPSSAVRSVCSEIRDVCVVAVLAAKGLESGTGLLVSEAAAASLSTDRIGALSGPNLATEIARGIPTAAISAFPAEEDAQKVRLAFTNPRFRVYASGDVIGVELSGALKNVLAIGAGMSDGLGFGNNTKGAFLARGLKEMVQLGTAMGARPDTFLGVAGVGDLFATAASNLSRNYRVGLSVGRGAPLADALAEIGQVAEGVETSHAAMALSARHEVKMPVFEAIHRVLGGEIAPMEAVSLLMERDTPYEGGRF